VPRERAGQRAVGAPATSPEGVRQVKGSGGRAAIATSNQSPSWRLRTPFGDSFRHSESRMRAAAEA
jgi:hypothetical protein